jgi:hypothetical protein
MEEWIASDMILTEPIAVPTTNFIMTSPALEMTDKRAVLSLSLSSDALSISWELINAGVLLGTGSHQGIVQTSLLNQKQYVPDILLRQKVLWKKRESFSLRIFLPGIIIPLLP